MSNATTKTAHTPGPWCFCRYGSIAWEIQGGGRALAVVNRQADSRLNILDAKRATATKRGEPDAQEAAEVERILAAAGEGEANARLMAAALDLLKALRAALPWLEDRATDEVRDFARAAIAKATGGEG